MEVPDYEKGLLVFDNLKGPLVLYFETREELFQKYLDENYPSEKPTALMIQPGHEKDIRHPKEGDTRPLITLYQNGFLSRVITEGGPTKEVIYDFTLGPKGRERARKIKENLSLEEYEKIINDSDLIIQRILQ